MCGNRCITCMYDLESSASLKRCRCEGTWRRVHIISCSYFESCLHRAFLLCFSYDRPQGPWNILIKWCYSIPRPWIKSHTGAPFWVKIPILKSYYTNKQWLDQSVIAISTSHYFTISPHSSPSTQENGSISHGPTYSFILFHILQFRPFVTISYKYPYPMIIT